MWRLCGLYNKSVACKAVMARLCVDARCVLYNRSWVCEAIMARLCVGVFMNVSVVLWFTSLLAVLACSGTPG